MPQKSFEELLKERTRSFAPAPKADAWDKIAAGLEDGGKKSPFLPYRIAIAASLLLLIGIAIFFAAQPSDKTVNELVQNANHQEETSVHDHLSHTPATNEMEMSSEVPLLKTNDSKGGQSVQSVQRRSMAAIGEDHKNKDLGLVHSEPSTTGEDVFALRLKSVRTLSNGQLILLDDAETQVPVGYHKVQTPVTKGKDKYRFFAGINAELINNNSVVKIREEYKDVMPYQSEYDYRKNYDLAAQTYGIGLFAGVETGRHSLSLGIRTFGVKYRMCVNNVEYDNSTGSYVRNTSSFNYASTDSFVAEVSGNGGGYVTNSLTYIGIPLTYSYKALVYKRFSLSLNGALQYNVLYKNNSQISRDEAGFYIKPEAGGSNNASKSLFSINAGCSFNVQLGKRFELMLSPQYSRSLQPVEKGIVSTGFQQHTLTAGLKFYPF